MGFTLYRGTTEEESLMAATSETSKASKEHNSDDGKTESTPTYTCITHDATANVTTTVNALQVIQIHAEENSTVVLTGNQFHVTQQTQTLSQHHHTQQQRCESCGRAHTSASAPPEASGISTCTTSGPAQRGAVSSGQVTIQTSSHGVPSVRYAPGPPERLEIVTLTTKLTGTVGREWKLLAAPLSISDADVNSIDYEERTLKLKINKLLTLWVDKDEGNDRTILSQLLGSLDGYNLEHDCQMSLKTL